jgi:hypothetical protein
MRKKDELIFDSVSCLFVCLSYVELDNFLPIFVKMRSETSHNLRIQSLKTASADLMTPMVSNFVSSVELSDPMDLATPSFWSRVALFCQRQYSRRTNANKNWWISLSNKLFRFGDRLCRKKLKIESFSPRALVLSESIHEGLNDNRWNLGPIGDFFKNLLEDSSVTKIIFPETFDQWNEKPEFFHTNERMLKMSDFFLSRGEQGKVNSIVPIAKTINLGAPRYSKFWCDQLAEFFLSSKSELYSSKGLKVLYVPIKISPGLPASTAEDIASHDRSVFELLDRYEGLQVWVKPHPRLRGAGYEKEKISKLTSSSDRIKVIDHLTDTSELASHADIIISPGSSFIPHCLWLGKPVILLDEWAKRGGYSFTFQSLCFPIEEVDGLLEQVLTGKTSLSVEKEKKMRSFFQLGMDCCKYEEFFVATLMELGKKSLS